MKISKTFQRYEYSQKLRYSYNTISGKKGWGSKTVIGADKDSQEKAKQELKDKLADFIKDREEKGSTVQLVGEVNFDTVDCVYL